MSYAANVGRLLALLLIASCGRLGFADQPQREDSGVIDAAPQLQCDQSTRFQIGASGATALAPVATQDGFALFAVTGTSVNGWAFEFADGQLVPGTQNAPLATSETGAIGAASSGASLMLTAMYGSPATGTALVPLDHTLAPLGTIDDDGGFATSGPVAGAAAGFAFATIDQANGEIDGQLSSPLAMMNMPVPIVAASEMAGAVSIVSTGSGYAVGYTSAASNPNPARIELLDANLAVITPPTTASDGQFGAGSVAIAWAPATNNYLVAWNDKTDQGNDRVLVAVLDGNLNTIVAPSVIATSSYGPTVTTDGTNFWVTWRSYVNNPAPDILAAARIAADGSVTPHAVTGSGGTPNLWSMIERDGQPVLVWTETGGTGPDLYLDPMCGS